MRPGVLAKLLSSRFFMYMLLPISILLIEGLIKGILNIDFWNTFGLSLSIIAFSQISPLILTENFYLVKVVTQDIQIRKSEGKISFDYNYLPELDSLEYNKLRKALFVVFFMSLVLFIVSLCTLSEDYSNLERNISGVLNIILVLALIT